MRQVLTDVGELPLAFVVQLGSGGVAGLDVDGRLRHGRTDWVTGGRGLVPSESAPTLAKGVQS